MAHFDAGVLQHRLAEIELGGVGERRQHRERTYCAEAAARKSFRCVKRWMYFSDELETNGPLWIGANLPFTYSSRLNQVFIRASTWSGHGARVA
jgi:hypothetical protein